VGAAGEAPDDVRAIAIIPDCGFGDDAGGFIWLRDVGAEEVEALRRVRSCGLEDRLRNGQ
jgi:hypothetical protein